MRKIKRYQKAVDVLIPRAAFGRLIREVAIEIDPDLRFTASTLEALQEGSEVYLVDLFEDCNTLALHTKNQGTKENRGKRKSIGPSKSTGKSRSRIPNKEQSVKK